MDHSKRRLLGARRVFGLIGHEVRRPAGAVGSVGRSAIVAGLQAAELIDDETSRSREIARLEEFVTDLDIAERRLGSTLSLARLVAQESEGTLKLRFASTDLSNLLQLAAADVTRQVRDDRLRPWNYSIEVHESAKRLGQIVCDEHYVSEVFKNILINAAKYSLPTRPTTRGVKSSVRVHIRGEPQKGWIGVKITNLGWAIPKDRRDVIFEPWVRGNVEAETEALPGMGLGLFLARRLMTAHGGEISCTSGRTDDVYIPRPLDGARPSGGVPAKRPEPVAIHETTFEVRLPRDLTPGVYTHRHGAALSNADDGSPTHTSRARQHEHS
jgi:signal transduction histidine kinase